MMNRSKRPPDMIVAPKGLRRLYLCCLALLLAWGATAIAQDRVHIVKRNDTLSAIARQYGVSVGDIVRQNQLRNSDYVQIGQRLVIPSQTPSHVEYTVRRGDSLAAIAQRFGVRVSALSSYNRIRDPNRIAIGQVLLIPSPSQGVAGASRPSLDAATLRSLEQTRVRPGWQRIVIHHSAAANDTPKSMDEYHRRGRRMENGLAYHFVIGNGRRTGDGEIYIGHRWTQQLDGGHLASAALNRESIGICLIGDFNHATPTRKQMESLHALVAHLMDGLRLDVDSVQTHRQANPVPTECPGSKFPTRQFLDQLRR